MDDTPPLQGGIYLSTAGRGSYGASPTVWQSDTYFRPWYFDGHVVHWGAFRATRSSAMQAAKLLAESSTSQHEIDA